VTRPGEEKDGPALTEDRPVGEEARRSLESYIAGLSVPQKIELASRGNREVRKILARDGSSVVARAVVNSPKISEEDVLLYASSAQSNDDLLRAVAENRQWTANRLIVAALVQNPRTPPPTAVRFLKTFQASELKNIVQNRGLSAVIRAEARRLLARKQ
jgi:hypothetical protein